MKAIILAAGIGSRLRPMTNEKPKTLVKVNNKPMLGHIIDALFLNGIRDVIVCTGFQSNQIVNYCKNNYPLINFIFVENKDYEDTNNMFSLFLARAYLNDDILLMNADLVFDSDIIKGLINEKGTAVAVDVGRYMEESMKVVLGDGTIRNISKKITKEASYGCSIDVYRISKEDAKFLSLEMEDIIENKKDKNQWTEVMLDNLFSSGKVMARPFDIKNMRWYEIDNYEDLSSAEMLFNDKLRDIKNKKIFFIDRDGTLTLGEGVIDGVIDFLRYLRKEGKYFFVATNNSSLTPQEHLDKLNKMGLSIEKDNVLVSSSSAIIFLQKNNIKRVFWVANDKVSKYFEDNGLVYEESDPQAILLTYDTQINYEKLKKLTGFVRKGVPYYATHGDIVCPMKEGSIPDIGTFIKLVEMTTGILPNKVFGKPDKSFIDPILEKYGLSYDDAVIIGDRLYTDIKLAENSDITSVLVLSGETKREDYEESVIRGDIIVSNLRDLLNFL
jgi:HAD superfamily hydrolase (TIGR01450 family)